MKRILTIILVFISVFAFGQKGKIIVPDGINNLGADIEIDNEGKYLYSANRDKIVMWEMRTTKQLYTFPLKSEELFNISVSNDGNKLLASTKGKLFCFSTKTGELLFEQETSIKTNAIFSPDDKLIFVMCYESFEIRNASDGSLIRVEANKGIYHNGEMFYIDNKSKLIIPQMASWKIVDPTSGKIIETIQTNVENMRYSGALPGKNLIIFRKQVDKTNGNRTWPGQVYDILTGKLIKQFLDDLIDVAITPSIDNDDFITKRLVGNEGVTELRDGNTLGVKKLIKPPLYAELSSPFSGKDGKIFVFQNDSLSLMNIHTSKKEKIFASNTVTAISDLTKRTWYNTHSGMFDFKPSDNLIKRFDFKNMRPVRHYSGNFYRMTNQEVAFSSSGDTVALIQNVTFDILDLKNNTTIKRNIPLQVPLSSDKLYYIKNGSLYLPVKNQLKDYTSIIKYDIATGKISEKLRNNVIEYRKYNDDASLLLTFDLVEEKTVSYNTIQKTYTYGVWDIEANKRIFSVPARGSGIFVSLDKKKVLALQGESLITYNMSDGKIISTSKEYKKGDNNNRLNYSPLSYINTSAASPDLSTFICSNVDDGVISIFDAVSGLKKQYKAHDASIDRINFSEDGKLFYTFSTDGTIKVWKTDSGEILGTLYFFRESNDYVFVTPDGRFDGTEGGMQKLYYLKGREVISLEKVMEKYYTPNLYQRLLAGEKFDPIPDIDFKPKPKTKIYYADVKKANEEERILTYTNNTGTAEITVSATAPEDKVDEIRLFHNGKAVNLATRGLFVADADGSDSKKYTINLLPGQNNFRAIALNSQRTESEPDEIIVAYNKGGGNAPVPVKPADDNKAVVDEIDRNATLHIVVVGINAYKGKINPLTYALPDATAFKAELEKDAKTFVSNVKSYLVTDDAASKAGIVAAFDNIKKSAKPEDVFVFYYAGHGYIHPSNKEFYLVSSDVADGGESLLKNGVSAKELQTFAVDIPAQKQLFIMDACQSAGAFEQMLKHDGEQQKALAVVSRSTGTHWMAASGSTETAKEFGELGHGVFTYSLLEALKGKAVNNKMITVNGLKNYLQVIVPELVKKYGGNSQYPASYGFGNDFPVEIVK